MNLKVATFNLFQFCSPQYSFYTKKDRFSQKDWEDKKFWIETQLKKMDCDIVGFQEVFSQDELKELCKKLGFNEFVVTQSAKLENNIFKTTTVALASKFKITNIEKVTTKDNFTFQREPIKATILLDNGTNILFYVAHLKSNRLNEFEYKFNENTTFEEKLNKMNIALRNGYSNSLKQRLDEAKALFFDIKNSKLPTILACDLNDKEFSLTIDFLTNKKFNFKNLDKDSFILYDSYNLAPKKVYNPHPELKNIKRVATSYFLGYANTLDYIFLSKYFKNRVINFQVFDEHLQKNRNGCLKQSDHAQVVCTINL